MHKDANVAKPEVHLLRKYSLSAKHDAGNWEWRQSGTQNRHGPAHMELTIQWKESQNKK